MTTNLTIKAIEDAMNKVMDLSSLGMGAGWPNRATFCGMDIVTIPPKIVQKIKHDWLDGTDMETKDDDIGSTEYWRDIKQARQEKRADNRQSSATYLRERGIPFAEKNFGAHLIVEGRECLIDFWPGTGKWHCRSGKKCFGVRRLVEYINAPSNAS